MLLFTPSSSLLLYDREELAGVSRMEGEQIVKLVRKINVKMI